MNVTSNEKSVLRAILCNDFTSLNGAIPASYQKEWIWSDCINDSAEPSDLTGRSLAAVVSSLCQKGLAQSDGECVGLTELGYNVAMRDRDPN